MNHGIETQEHERDYAPWDEARVTVSWIGVCDGGALGKVSHAWTTRDKVSCVRRIGDTEL